ncbi:MAG: damage-control phosphatase ARMT1 family protein, partial [Anaerolineales bacterium]
FQVQTSEVFRNLRGLRVDFLVDNAGFELVSDLVFADYLLSSGLTGVVRLHVKPHPTYVSDAMIKDVRTTLDFFEADSDPQVNALGSRLTNDWERDRLQVKENFFWTSPLPAWEMPVLLRDELSAADLVISKGDANYRRLLGDLDWPFTTPFADILAYFPAPIVALRTVKAEIACGLQPGQAENVAAQDPDWMIDGRWGVVQFAR